MRTMLRMTRRTVSRISQRSLYTRAPTENGCATSGSQSGALEELIAAALTIPVDKEEEANRLIDQILVLQETLDDLTSRIGGAWKFPLSGLIKKTLLK